LKAIKVAVDASRVRSGGGVAHIIGILSLDDPAEFGISEIHIWSYKLLLDALPNCAWLIKHHPDELEQSLFQQLAWQRTKLAKEIKSTGCQILFSVDASTVCRFKPMVVLNQNMLAYDDGVLGLFGWGKDRIQQTLMFYVQKKAFKFADAVIFLTQHSARQVQKKIGTLSKTICIPHGVGQIYKETAVKNSWPASIAVPVRCLYVSPIFEYKHQCEVVHAVKLMRDEGKNITLTLVGGGGKRAKKQLLEQLNIFDPQREFVEILEFLPSNQIAELLSGANLFVFASSCETFGIALFEAMTVGLPIACSNRSSMPESLQDGGEYFDPQDPYSIARALRALFDSPDKRTSYARRARELASFYNWQRCSSETWTFISQCYTAAARLSEKR
jgi:glycosyltransferase involved in cell wall biosynthesis